MRRARRIGVQILALGGLAFLLTGCLKLNMDLEVAADDTVSGTAVIGFDKELLALTGDSFDDVLGDDSIVPSDIEGVSVEPYDDGEFIGQEVTFDGVALEEFNREQVEQDALRIVREGDTFRMSGVLDFDTGDAGEAPIDGGELLEGADVRITVAFPGEVLETNGERDGNTVTWRPVVGERTELLAIASAIDSGGGSSILWIVLALVAVALVAGIIVLSRRKAPPPSAGGTPHDEVIADEEGAVRGGPVEESPFGSALTPAPPPPTPIDAPAPPAPIDHPPAPRGEGPIDGDDPDGAH